MTGFMSILNAENLWMLAMLGMFGLFLRGLQVEARRSLQAIARDDEDHSWRAEMQSVMAQRQARQRLIEMRAEQAKQDAKQEAARRNKEFKAEREALRAAQVRRSRWEYQAPRGAPKNEHDDYDLSGEAFGDHGFARIAEIIDEDELYVPVRSFNERVNRLSDKGSAEQADGALQFEVDFPARREVREERIAELQHA